MSKKNEKIIVSSNRKEDNGDEKYIQKFKENFCEFLEQIKQKEKELDVKKN